MADTSYFSRMRVFRGRDEAVNIIGNRATLIDLLQNSEIHRREELIEAIMSCYSGASYRDSNWSKVIGAWGDSPKRVTIHGTFAEQYPHLAQLNLDQGLVTHLPEFVEFLRPQGAEDHLATRASFREHLGVQTVWRGIVLTEEEAERTRTEGIESDFLRKQNSLPSVIEHFEANVLSVYFSELVERHFRGENYHSPLISVSSHKDVAIAVGRYFGDLYRGGKSLYLFKIRIPEIDLVYYTEHAAKISPILQDSVRNGTHFHVTVDGIHSSYPWGRQVESYVMYKINPKEIVEVSKPEVSKTSWSSRGSL